MSSALKQLQAATSLHDLANLLKIKPAFLSYTLYKIAPEAKYSQFEIPKKSGGFRVIDAPIARLKSVQQKLAALLYKCQVEIKLGRPPRKTISHGFKKEHSIATNAAPHKKRRYVFNLDIEDFFPTINFGRVRGFFIKNRDYHLDKGIATIIAQIACHRNALPQGSPCSPIISDLITHLLDIRLAQLAKKSGCMYTRYADDLTFSTNLKLFPREIASQDGESWIASKQLTETIVRGGYKINSKKTRMHYRISRQTVTGLTVNRKVNIRADYYRLARAMSNQLFKTGSFNLVQPSRSTLAKRREKNSSWMPGWLVSLLNFFRRKSPNSDQPTQPHPPANPTLKRLEGILNHVHYIKDMGDKRPETKKRSNPIPIRKIYREFLFFKYFVDIQRPLIVGEGKTDNIYLSIAMRKLSNVYPQLVEKSGTKLNSKVQLFNRRSKRAQKILKLDSGSASLGFLVRDYAEMMKRYRYAPTQHPVIILVDNDKGAKDVFDAFKTATGKTISLNSTDQFYHVCHNLYLVKTPESAKPNSMSCIEDGFDAATLAIRISGKKFNPDSENDTSTEYGKAVFAEKVVVAQADKISFAGFQPLFDRIIAVLNHYKI